MHTLCTQVMICEQRVTQVLMLKTIICSGRWGDVQGKVQGITTALLFAFNNALENAQFGLAGIVDITSVRLCYK